MIRKILMLAILTMVSAPARAIDPKQLETDWTYDLTFASFTGVTSGVFDPAGLPPGTGISSNPDLNIIGHAWSIKSVGADANFTISFATKTYATGAVNAGSFNSSFPSRMAGSAPAISTSVVSMSLNGDYLTGTFEDVTTNPVFTFSGLSAAATTYIWVEIGRHLRR